jgi:tetratricopeptide (TPR) repeat protein
MKLGRMLNESNMAALFGALLSRNQLDPGIRRGALGTIKLLVPAALAGVLAMTAWPQTMRPNCNPPTTPGEYILSTTDGVPGSPNAQLRYDLPPACSDSGFRPVVSTVSTNTQTVSIISLQTPERARKAYEKGLAALKTKRFAEATKEFHKALRSYPRYAAAWYQLGTALGSQGHAEEARECYARAIAYDSRFVSPHLRLAVISSQEKDWPELAAHAAQVIQFDPLSFPEAYIFQAMALYNLHELDAAEKSARKAQEIDEVHRYPEVNWVLGTILAEKGDWCGALDQMRLYLVLAPNGPYSGRVRQQLDKIERLTSNK